MPCTLVDTAGAANANSYASIAAADAYHDAHVSGATWAALSTDQKCRALVQATRQLDTYMDWAGTAATTTQALGFPRVGLTDPATGATVDAASIPARLANATAEQARILAAGDRAVESGQSAANVESLKVGPIELAFNSSVQAGTTGPVIAPSAFEMVADWGRQASGAGGTVPLIRV